MTPTPTQSILQLLEETLPPYFPRNKVHELTFGLINPRTLANKESKNGGLGGRFFVNRKVWYKKDEFIKYVESILKDAAPSS